MIAVVMSLIITNITLAQKTPPGVSRPTQVGTVRSVSATVAPVESVSAVGPATEEYYEEGGYGEYGLEMMMEPYNVSRSSLRTGRKVFIIPAAEIKKEDHLAIERDITIMSHIFDRVLKKPQMLGGVFKVMDDFFGRDSRVTEIIFLDGYGALFFMEVNFVLTGTSEIPKEREPNEPKEHVDSIWKRAELEIYAPTRLQRGRQSRSEPMYDPEKVEVLKKNLIETLKHAANIQALETNDLVILTVIGRTSQPVSVIRGRTIRTSRGGEWTPAISSTNKAVSFPSVPTVLTIRVKKSDIDAYSKGELDFDKFQERIQIFSHWK
jgi:hypothetical protein